MNRSESGTAFEIDDLEPFTLHLAFTADFADRELLSVRTDSATVLSVRTGEMSGSFSIIVEARFDFREKPLVLSCPIERTAAGKRMTAAVRYSGPRIELFIDGVLADEEWPVGSPITDGEDYTVDSNPEVVRSVSFWGRVLTDAEIGALSGAGGAGGPPETGIGMYWKPAGHDTSVGDCMPFSHNDVFHLFYLYDRRGHGSKWGLGAHQWFHASTRDLKTWDHHPPAVPITEEWEGSICTGSVFHDRGNYYCFYSIRDAFGGGAPLRRSVSGDGIHFEKDEAGMRVLLRDPYDPVPARDPCVFRDDGRLYHMLVTTELRDEPVSRRRGALAHLTSRDLGSWVQREPFIVPGFADQPECSDYFVWNGWCYLIFSNHGVARYLKSRQPFGPWERPAFDVFDGPMSGVMKTAAWTGNRRIGASFLRRGGYGGNLILREIRQESDGTLTTRFLPELLPDSPGDPPADLVPLTPGVAIGEDGSVTIDGSAGFSACEVVHGLTDYFLRLTVEPEAGCRGFGVCVGADQAYSHGMELRMEPWKRKAGWRPTGGSDTAEYERQALYAVEELAGPVTVEIIVRGDVRDVCIGGRKTLITFDPEPVTDGTLILFCHLGRAAFRDITISPVRSEVTRSVRDT